MHPWLLSGEEKEPESTFSVNRGRHNGTPPVTVSSRLTVFVGSSGFPWIDCTIAHWRQPFLSLKNAAYIPLGCITCYPQGYSSTMRGTDFSHMLETFRPMEWRSNDRCTDSSLHWNRCSGVSGLGFLHYFLNISLACTKTCLRASRCESSMSSRIGTMYS